MIVTMNNLLLIILPALIAFLCACWIHPYVLKVAKVKNIVDKPNARKLQHVPIPILGGLTVVFGILSGIMSFQLFGEYADFFPVFASVFIILIIGLLDDMISLSPKVRFIIEIVLVLYLILTTGFQINDFHGLWGIDVISKYVSLPLTIFACVGIINAINLIDGVDGLCSGYGMFASLLFAICFLRMGDVSYAVFAFTTFGALIPFWLHNTFGKSSKMFLGDGGSLILGFICSLFVTHVVQSGQEVVTGSTISLTLAVLAVPVFDTLRVMTARMMQRRSPFSPDKTHLHHMFIELGFSHVITAVNIVLLNGMVVAIWYICSLLELSAEMQLYIVIASGLMFTVGLYHGVQFIQKRSPASYASMQRLVKKYSIHRTGLLLYIQRVLDR